MTSVRLLLLNGTLLNVFGSGFASVDYNDEPAAPARSLAHFSLAELQENTPSVRASLRKALETEGAVLIEDVPGFEITAVETLDEFGKCLKQVEDVSLATLDNAGPLRRVMSHSVERLTLATSAEAGQAEPLPVWAMKQCPGLRIPAARLRALFDWIITLFSRRVDDITDADLSATQPRLQDVVRLGTRIEHFHRYSYMDPATRDESASSHEKVYPLQMHTDMGLFQALAIRWHGASDLEALTLNIEMPDGSLVSAESSAKISGKLNALSKGSGILLLMGQGSTQWMPHLKVRAAPHALAVDSMRGVDRLVYGVMVLPPKDWPMFGNSGSNITFGEWWRRAKGALAARTSDGELSTDKPSVKIKPHEIDSSSFGCLSAGALHRRLEDLTDSCDAGEIYCWMQCVTTHHLPCDTSSALCMSGQTGQPCAGDTSHDASCKPQCPIIPTESMDQNSTFAPRGDFCNGILTDMHMTGFVWAGKELPCLVLLFPGLELTDHTRFCLAIVGTVIAGLLAEFIIAFRRKVDSTPVALGSTATRTRFWSRFQSGRKLILYAGSRAWGYFVMLIAMTYSAELFIAVVLGLTLGHALFNLSATTGEDMTPCCQGSAVRPPTPIASQQVRVFSAGGLTRSQARFHVTGMTCNSCLETVMKAVNGLSGVQAVLQFSLESGLMEVELSSEALDAQEHRALADQVCKAIEDIGFAALYIPTDSHEGSDKVTTARGEISSPSDLSKLQEEIAIIRNELQELQRQRRESERPDHRHAEQTV